MPSGPAVPGTPQVHHRNMTSPNPTNTKSVVLVKHPDNGSVYLSRTQIQHRRQHMIHENSLLGKLGNKIGKNGTIIETPWNQIEKRTKAKSAILPSDLMLDTPYPQTGLSSSLGFYLLLRPISTPEARHHHVLPPNSLSRLRCPLLRAPLGPITVFATK